MFKRLRWLFLGAVLGVAAYLWATRRAKEAVPAAGRQAVAQGAAAARGLAGRLGEALREGRAAMEAREAELRRELL